MTRVYHRFLIYGGLALAGLAGTMIVQGGWQAVCAAFGIFAAARFGISFIRLRAASEQPRSRYPDWSRATPEPHGSRRETPAPAVRPRLEGYAAAEITGGDAARPAPAPAS